MAHHGRNPLHEMPDEMKRLVKEGPMNMGREETLRKTLLDAPNDEERKQVLRRSLLETTNLVGATGQFPQGKIHPDDEGGIQFRVGSEGGKVVLDFGSPVAWVGMDPQQAADLASSLLKWARIVGRKAGETVTINLQAP